MTRLTPDPANIVWRSGSGRAVFSIVTALFLALFAAALLAVAWFLLVPVGATMNDIPVGARWTFAIVLLVIGVYCAALARLVWRNARGFWKGWMTADAEGIAFHLPRDRSLMHRPLAADGHYAWSAIERLESRLEAYRSQLMAQVQRTYWLVPQAGERLLLFEDRALATPYAILRGEKAFEKLAAMDRVPVVEAEMVEGRGGLLGAWFTTAPGKTAPAMDESAARAVWQRAVSTGKIAGVAATIVLTAMIISRLLGG
jgi:hypothetical protein